MKPRVAELALALACLAGCAGPEPLPLPTPPAGPARPALAIAPIGTAYAPSVDRPRRLTPVSVRGGEWLCGACDEYVAVPPLPCSSCGGDPLRTPFAQPYRPRVELDRPRRRAAAHLEARGTFERVMLLSSDDPAAWRATGRAAGARFLLEPTLQDVRVELLEKNAWYPLKLFNLIVGALAIIPILDPVDGLIPGEEYGVIQVLAWRVTDLAAEHETAGRVERVTRAAFNDFGPGPSRGYIFFGTVRTPGCLDEAEWAEIHAQLAEVAAEDLAGAVVLAAEEGARPR